MFAGALPPHNYLALVENGAFPTIYEDYPPPRCFLATGSPHRSLPFLSLPDSGFAMDSRGVQFQLELRNVSYIRSFVTGRWLSKVINAPITAQFLKDVSFQTRGGEVMGIIGSGGSGKTTLLNVIARRVQGTTGGSILLNGRHLTERVFRRNCAYVSFQQDLLDQLTVLETLRYEANMGIASTISHTERYERVYQILREFELEGVRGDLVSRLDEAARRRLIIAQHLIRDPVLIVIDEPTRGLPPLAVYQLMSLTSGYMKRYNRIAVVSMQLPRSDIYPLLDRTTLLFFGEVIYSGYTKQMPQYFRHIGFPCPASENPAVYFASLASVDRETSGRYLETQEQAVKLIETFKLEGDPYAIYAVPFPEASAIAPSFAPMSSFGRPGCVTKLGNLMSRITKTEIRKLAFLPRILTLPCFGVLLFLVNFRLSHSPYTPATRGGILFNCLAASGLIGAGLVAPAFSKHRTKFYQDAWDALYSGSEFILAYFIANFFFDLIAVITFSAIVYWACNLQGDILSFVYLFGLLWCSQTFAQFQTYCLLSFIRPPFAAAGLSLTIILLQLVTSSGYIKSLLAMKESMEWLYYLSYASLYRFAGAFLQRHFIQGMDFRFNPRNLSQPLCCRSQVACLLRNRLEDQRYCRWVNGTDYLIERYEREDYSNVWLNFGLPFGFTAFMMLVTFILYCMPMPHVVKRQFRSK